MRQDEYGFPEPASFDDEPRRIRPKITLSRVMVLLSIVLLVGMAAGFLELSQGMMDRLGVKLVGPVGNNARRVAAQKIKILFDRQDFEKALIECDKLAKIDPQAGYYCKVEILTRLGRYQDTIPVYGQILSHFPKDARAYNDRAYHRALVRIEIDEAEKDCARAIELDSDEPAFIDTRGYLHYLRGRFKPALADFNYVIRMCEKGDDPRAFSGLGEIYFHRGLVNRQLGQEDLAKQDFAKAEAYQYQIKDYPPPLAGEGKPAVNAAAAQK